MTDNGLELLDKGGIRASNQNHHQLRADGTTVQEGDQQVPQRSQGRREEVVQEGSASIRNRLLPIHPPSNSAICE